MIQCTIKHSLITCQEIGPQCQEAEARDRSTPVNADGSDNPFATTDIGYLLRTYCIFRENTLGI